MKTITKTALTAIVLMGVSAPAYAINCNDVKTSPVTCGDLVTGAVDTDEIADGAVTEDKLSPDVQAKLNTPGPAGADGKDGKDGADGKDGKDGVDGKDGAQGLKGDKGDKGLKGDKGDKGDQGVAGKDGIDGKDFDPADLEKGLATTAALTVPHIDPGKKFGIAVSPAFFNEEAAIGVGVGLRLDDTWQLGGSVATDFDGKNVAGKGVLTGQW